MAPLVESTPFRWFTQAYRENHSGEMERVRAMVARADAASYAACCGVLRDTDLRSEVSSVVAPCLIVTGTHDAATPPSEGRALQELLRDAKYLELDCSHISSWERPEEFARAMFLFLTEGEDAHG